MIDILVFIKEPLPLKTGVLVYPPSIKEVVSNPDFNKSFKLLTLTEDDIEEEFLKGVKLEKELTPFEFLMVSCAQSKDFLGLVQAGMEFFVKQKITIMPEQGRVFVGELSTLIQKVKTVEDIPQITEEDFPNLQRLIRASCGMKQPPPREKPNPNEDPRITAMKEKARRRDRLKAKQGIKDGISLHTSLVAICCMGIGLTPLNIGEMSYAAIGPLMAMSADKEKYDIDIRSLLAGADSKKVKPKYWIRNQDINN